MNDSNSESQEVPRWLKELEEKREKRLKARLGHETGAGSPCLTCLDKCPGLDLHFWRKICKNCKCGKENHDFHDDDIYGWAKLELLGSRPEKPHRIVLPDHKEAVELEWTPKGEIDLVESYLKDLPRHLLPIKGSAAAKERKQLLQKQIPLHDIDPTLCHALSDLEIEQMNEYVAFMKENSVGVGHIVKLSNFRANVPASGATLHVGGVSSQISMSQNVPLKGADRASPLKSIAANLQDLSLNEKKTLNPIEDQQNFIDSLGRIRTKRGEMLQNRQYFNKGANLPNFNFNETNQTELPLEKCDNLKGGLPKNYATSKYNTYLDNRDPTVIKNVTDINYSPYSNLENQQYANNPCYDAQKVDPLNNSEILDKKNLHHSVCSDVGYIKGEKLGNLKSNLPKNYASTNYNTYLDNRNPVNFKSPQDINYPLYSNQIPDVDIKNLLPTEQISSKRIFPLNPSKNNIPLNPNLIETLQNPIYPTVGSIYDLEYPLHEAELTPQNLQDFDYSKGKTISPSALPEYQSEIPECHRCKKMFEDNANAIGIEKTNALWHSDCFRCAGCNQLLADWLYFFDKETDNVYCGRDYAKIRGIPRCNACDELIFVKEYCLAENNTFHVKHFCCFQCDEPLAGKNYLMEDGQPLCLPCFEKLKAERCNTCHEIIKPDQSGANLNGVHFHADDACFSCKICRKPLLGLKFMFKNQILYCSAACYSVGAN